MIGISEQIANTPVRKEFLGFGDDAIARTLNIMKTIINESSQNYYVRRWAEKMVAGTDNCPYEKMNAIFDFLANNTQYIKDTHNFELLKTPIVSLQLLEIDETPQLDCDCYVILSLSLLKSIGIPVAIKAIATKSDKRFDHVYGLALAKQGWIALDLVRSDRGLGWSFPNPYRLTVLEV